MIGTGLRSAASPPPPLASRSNEEASTSARVPDGMALSGEGVVCRTCLSSRELAPLFSEPAHYSNSQLALRLTTGLQCDLDDGLPAFLCATCRQLLEAFMLFRFQSKIADQWLRLRCGTPRQNSATTSPEQTPSVVKLETLPTALELKQEAKMKLAEFYKNNTTYVSEVLYVDAIDRKMAGDDPTIECQLAEEPLVSELEKTMHELKVAQNIDSYPVAHTYVNTTDSHDAGEYYVEFDTEKEDILNYANILERHTAETKPVVEYSVIEVGEAGGETSSNFMKSETLEDGRAERPVEDYSIPAQVKRPLVTPNITCAQSMIVIDCLQPQTGSSKRKENVKANKNLKPPMKNINAHVKKEPYGRHPGFSETATQNMYKFNRTASQSLVVDAARRKERREIFSDGSMSMVARYLAWRRSLDAGSRPHRPRLTSALSEQRSKIKGTPSKFASIFDEYIGRTGASIFTKRSESKMRPSAKVLSNFDKYTQSKKAPAKVSSKKTKPAKVLGNSKNETPIEVEFVSKVAESSMEFRHRAMQLVEGPVNRHSTHLECKLCRAVYKNIRTFESHAHTHFGYKHLCEFCGKGFPTRGPLRKHLQSMHGFERDWPCSYCDCKFVYPERLKIHEMRFHTKERPFICDQCGSGYFSKPILTQHIRLAHQEGRPYKCDECPRTFKILASRNYHKKIVHHPTYKFLCHICNSTFTKVRHARKHFLRIHKIPKEQQVVKVHRLYFDKSPLSDAVKRIQQG